jgi:hypothetical protein
LRRTARSRALALGVALFTCCTVDAEASTATVATTDVARLIITAAPSDGANKIVLSSMGDDMLVEDSGLSGITAGAGACKSIRRT